jgi:beta-galactosidase
LSIQDCRAWLCEKYPQLLAKKIDGEILHPGSISYVHPLFLEKTRAWFDQVVPRIARHTVTRGGPVAFTQFDNELGGIHTWFGSLDYNPESMGFGDPQGRYPRYLQGKYVKIERINERYGTGYHDFAEARPIAQPGSGAPEDLRRLKDYFEFYLSTIAEYGLTLATMLRERGIDTPLVHNSANPEMNAWFIEMTGKMGADFLLGSDHYYCLAQDWNQNNPTPQ